MKYLNPLRPVTITTNENGLGSFTIGDHDISNDVMGYSITHRAGNTPRLTIDLAAGVPAAGFSTAEIDLAAGTRAYLIDAGWTPPSALPPERTSDDTAQTAEQIKAAWNALRPVLQQCWPALRNAGILEVLDLEPVPPRPVTYRRDPNPVLLSALTKSILGTAIMDVETARDNPPDTADSTPWASPEDWRCGMSDAIGILQKLVAAQLPLSLIDVYEMSRRCLEDDHTGQLIETRGALSFALQKVRNGKQQLAAAREDARTAQWRLRRVRDVAESWGCDGSDSERTEMAAEVLAALDGDSQ